MVGYDNGSGPGGYSPMTAYQMLQYVQIVTIVCAFCCVSKVNPVFWQGNIENSPSLCPPTEECPHDILEITEADDKIANDFMILEVNKAIQYLNMIK